MRGVHVELRSAMQDKRLVRLGKPSRGVWCKRKMPCKTSMGSRVREREGRKDRARECQASPALGKHFALAGLLSAFSFTGGPWRLFGSFGNPSVLALPLPLLGCFGRSVGWSVSPCYLAVCYSHSRGAHAWLIKSEKSGGALNFQTKPENSL